MIDKKLTLHTITSFSLLREKNFIYVDKTAKLENLIKNGAAYFLARPHGFGKSLTLSTITAMFNGKAELFKGLAAYKFVKQYAEHPYAVINFDFGSLEAESLQGFEKSFAKMLFNVANNFGIDLQHHISDLSVIDIFKYIYEKFGSFVVLIDNYDKPIMDCINDTNLLFSIYTILKSFYNKINSYNNAINFLFITGVERYNNFGVFSTMKNLTDISTRKKYGDILGYTHEELERNFTSNIDQESLNISSKHFFEQLKLYNDQFCFDGVTNIYHPYAILKSLEFGDPRIYGLYINDNPYTNFEYSCINPGDRPFLDAKNSKIYVDKSELLIYTNERIGTNDKYICITRPSNFGKTITLNMIAAYYDRTCNARNTFNGLKITKHKSFSLFSNRYIVIKITMIDYIYAAKDIDSIIKKLRDDITNDLIRQFGNKYPLDYLDKLMRSITMSTGLKFVVLIDEYDCLLRTFKDKLDWQKKFLDFLCYLLKDKEYIALAYMTGILPIKKYGTHSALNVFNEYTMIYSGKFSESLGFTQSEVKNLCLKYNCDFSECEKLYDGYEIRGFSHIYNPKSVNEYISSCLFSNSFKTTETYEDLEFYINIEKYGIRDIILNLLAGNSITINPYTFDNDMISFESSDDILTLLVHLGYLSYNYSTSTVRIPNKAIAS